MSSSMDDKTAANSPAGSAEQLPKHSGEAAQETTTLSTLPKLGSLEPPVEEKDVQGDGDGFPADDTVSFDKTLIPARYRFAAFAMVVFFATSSSFAQNTLSPLKSTLKKELGVNNAQYGAISSASSLVNTILPLIGGLWMDRWGATYAAIICSVFIMVGAIIGSISANTGNYRLLIGGQIIMGFGSTVIESCQSKLYAHWFQGSTLGFVFALDIAWSRITTIICRASAVPMSHVNGWWGWALWIPAILTVANLALCIAYWAYERTVPKVYQPPLGKNARNQEGWDKKKLALKPLLNLPMFFWIMCATQVFQNASVTVYTSNLADIQTQTRGTSTLAAGYNSSLQGIIPIVMTPVVGYFFDRFGWRMIFVSWTAILYVIVFALIGLTTVNPLGPIILSSFALSTNAITFIASIPVLVGNDELLGTAFGIWKAFANCNTIILEVAAGAIQDRTPGGSYDRVIYMIIAFKAMEILWGPIYDILDGRLLGHSLRMPEKKRVAFRRDVKQRGDDLRGWQVSKSTFYGCGGLLCALIVTGWVVYIIYSLGT